MVVTESLPAVANRVAAIQMCSGASITSNLKQAQDLIAEAALRGARLVVLPENFALLGAEEPRSVERIESENSGPDGLRKWLAKMARCYGIWIVGGSISMTRRPDGTSIEKRVRAACLVFNDQGEEVARYDKIHLFDVDVADDYGAYRESDTVEPGDQMVLVDTPCGKLGLSICYDLRFPELFHNLRRRGADIICVPSAFTATTGAAHWMLLLRARAIETQCYLVAPDQVGQHSRTRCSYGHSMIVDPWGKVLASLADEPGVVSADIDPERLAEVRRRMPMAQHHRLVFD